MHRTKTVPATYEIKADEESGGWIVEGYASIFGNVDSYGDVVQKGAFSKTVKERMPKGKIRFFWDHMQPLGVPLSLEEDEQGLKFRGRISKTALGQDVKTLVEDGAVGDFSFGYDLVGGESKNKPNEHGGLNVTEVKLWEVSLVGIGANEEAMLTGVKSLQNQYESVKSEFDAMREEIRGLSEKAEPGEVKVGDSVTWGGNDDMEAPAGVIESIHNDGPVPDIEAEVMGTVDDPAARIQVWSQDDAGAWSPSDTYVGHKLSTLSPRPALQEQVSGAGEKSGRVLSAKNKELVGKAVATLEDARTALKSLLEAVEPDKATPELDEKEIDPEMLQSLSKELEEIRLSMKGN